MTDFISALKSEIKERNGVIEMLDQADSFYDNQRGEAKLVCNVSEMILKYYKLHVVRRGQSYKDNYSQ